MAVTRRIVDDLTVLFYMVCGPSQVRPALTGLRNRARVGNRRTICRLNSVMTQLRLPS